MRRRLTLLILCLMLFVPGEVLAVENTQSTLILPKTYGQKAGDRYPMTMKIALPSTYRRDYKTVSISLMMDAAIHVEKTTVEGRLSDNEYRVMTSENDDTNREIITLVVPEADEMRGPEFSIHMEGVFKPGTQNIDEVAVSYVMTTVDSRGKSSSIQRKVVSEKGQPKPSGLHRVDPILPGENTLTGQSVAGAEIRVFRGKTLIGSGIAEDDGAFSIVINPQPEGAELSFIFDSTKGSETIQATVGPAIDPDTPLDPLEKKVRDYLDILARADMTRSPEIDRLQVNAAVAATEFVLAKDVRDPGELARVQKEMESAMKVARPGYMSGYPDGTFGPKKPMTRAEVAAVFTRIMNHGEDPAAFSSFKDIDDGKWYASSVGYIEKKGLITGYEDGTFKPMRSITRAEFAKILASFAELEPVDDISFKDVKSNHWARGYIGAVERAGLMKGRGGSKFAPSDKITREELSAAMNKAIGRQPDKEFLKAYASNPFKDVNSKMWSYYDIIEAAGEPK